jgi:Flp pilus assembly protein TadG
VQYNATKFDDFELSEKGSQISYSLPARPRRAGFSMVNHHIKPDSGDRQRGQSMIEFAFTLIIILVLLVGLIDLGRAIFTYLGLRDAAQEGASFASYNPNDTTGITARVCNSSNMVSDLCTSPGIDTDVNIIGSACSGNGVEVVVTLNNFTLVTPFLGAIVGSQTIPITARVTDSILAPPCT